MSQSSNNINFILVNSLILLSSVSYFGYGNLPAWGQFIIGITGLLLLVFLIIRWCYSSKRETNSKNIRKKQYHVHDIINTVFYINFALVMVMKFSIKSSFFFMDYIYCFLLGMYTTNIIINYFYFNISKRKN